MNEDEFPVTLIWSDEWECWVSTDPDMPELNIFNHTEEEAKVQAKIAMRDLVEAYRAKGLPLPPAKKVECCGKLFGLYVSRDADDPGPDPDATHFTLHHHRFSLAGEGITLDAALDDLLEDLRVCTKVFVDNPTNEKLSLDAIEFGEWLRTEIKLPE